MLCNVNDAVRSMTPDQTAIVELLRHKALTLCCTASLQTSNNKYRSYLAPISYCNHCQPHATLKVLLNSPAHVLHSAVLPPLLLQHPQPRLQVVPLLPWRWRRLTTPVRSVCHWVMSALSPPASNTREATGAWNECKQRFERHSALHGYQSIVTHATSRWACIRVPCVTYLLA